MTVLPLCPSDLLFTLMGGLPDYLRACNPNSQSPPVMNTNSLSCLGLVLATPSVFILAILIPSWGQGRFRDLKRYKEENSKGKVNSSKVRRTSRFDDWEHTRRPQCEGVSRQWARRHSKYMLGFQEADTDSLEMVVELKKGGWRLWRLKHHVEGLSLEMRRAVILRHAKEKKWKRIQRNFPRKGEVKGVYIHSSWYL